MDKVARRETIELLSFRRTFTLLIVLMVLPSAGLSWFGVVAIINERAAVEKRLEALWASRLSTAQRELEERLGRLDHAEGPLGLTLTDLEGPLCESPFRVEDGVVVSPDPRLVSVVNTLGAELAAAPPRPVVFSVTTPQGTFLLAVMRSAGGAVLGCQVSVEAVQRILDGIGSPLAAGESARLELVPMQREVASTGVVGRLVTGVSDVRQALEAQPLAGLTFPPPLQDFRLVAQPLDEDPVGQASLRNRIVYGVLLLLFYVALILGVIFTGRSLYREARLSRLKTDFVSLVSHELRTPLTSIRMFIDMLALGRVTDPKQMQTVVELLSKETSRLSGMIESVLDWSRIESGKKTYERTPVAPRELAEAAASAFTTLRLGAPMDFSVEVDDSLPEVLVDADAMTQALLNLLQNAFKYTGADKRIVLRVRGGGDQVAFEVEDNGIGIPRRELRRVFERFYRVDNLLTRSTEGSGLGLAIAQRIAHAHGGRITVDSTPGKGSTFTIRLPAAAMT